MKKNIFESQWTTIGNIIALASLAVALKEAENEFSYVCYMILILAIPFYILGVISIIRYNSIIVCGQNVKAEILPQSFQLKRDYRGTSQFEYSCKYNAQYYKGTVSVRNKDKEKMLDYVKQNPDIQIVLDWKNDRNVILITSYLKDVCYCLDGYFCNAKANYIMSIVIVFLAIMNVIW